MKVGSIRERYMIVSLLNFIAYERFFMTEKLSVFNICLDQVFPQHTQKVNIILYSFICSCSHYKMFMRACHQLQLHSSGTRNSVYSDHADSPHSPIVKEGEAGLLDYILTMFVVYILTVRFLTACTFYFY